MPDPSDQSVRAILLTARPPTARGLAAGGMAPLDEKCQDGCTVDPPTQRGPVRLGLQINATRL